MTEDEAKQFVDSVFDLLAEKAEDHPIALATIAATKAVVDLEFDAFWDKYVRRHQ